jgi:hypothetical protein
LLNNEQLLEDILDIDKKELHITQVAPLNRMGLPKDAISYLKLPLPLNHKNPLSKLKSIRLAIILAFSNPPVPDSCLFFSFESTCGDSYISDISNHDMQNYYSDMRHILVNNYSLKGVGFGEGNITKDFVVNFKGYFKPYSIEEVKTILYIYNNPIEFKDNYLHVA